MIKKLDLYKIRYKKACFKTVKKKFTNAQQQQQQGGYTCTKATHGYGHESYTYLSFRILHLIKKILRTYKKWS